MKSEVSPTGFVDPDHPAEGRPDLQAKRKLLFVVGSPRSGTTWLQLLLAQHPQVATDKETQLFTQYVKRLQDRWEEEFEEAETGTTNGLSRLMSEEEFLVAVRGFCDRVFEHLARDRPKSRVVLEKSPEHGLHAETILSMYPDAWFLHIIRDPRAVSNSFRHAADKWWTWAPSGPVSTTRRWTENVTEGRRIGTLTKRYREVRYEDLLDRGPSTLASLFEWLELEATDEFCSQAVEACRIERLKGKSPAPSQPWDTEKEPEGFFRSGKAESWRNELPRSSIRIIEHEASELMATLSYVPECRPRSLPWRSRTYAWFSALDELVRDLGRRVGWRLDRFRRRL